MDQTQTTSEFALNVSSRYVPRKDDYVRWNRSTGEVDEGWVYFKGDEYISIEVLAKCKTDENVKHCPLHKKIYVLIVCQNWFWNELEYISNRRVPEVTSGADADFDTSTYKSQEYRYD